MRGNVRILCLKYNNFETLIHYLKTDIRVKKKKKRTLDYRTAFNIQIIQKCHTPPPPTPTSEKNPHTDTQFV